MSACARHRLTKPWTTLNVTVVPATPRAGEFNGNHAISAKPTALRPSVTDMRPPFSAAEFFQVFVRYNEAVWPLQLLLVAAAVALVIVAVVSPQRSRVVIAGLAALWAYAALAYHLVFFAALTPAAYLFAALFLTEAALLAWHGLRTRRLHLAVPPDLPSRIIGGVLVLYAVVGYPALALASGQHYPAVPTFGVPCPTTILTFGVLMWCLRPVPWSVLVVPAVWSLIATVAAAAFGVVEDFALPAAAALALGMLLRRPPRVSRSVAPAARPVQLGF
jgi:hypothetical protein